MRDVAAAQLGLVTAAQLADLGVTRSTVSRSSRLGGMFSWVLPGIHRVDGRGPLSADQRDLAALLYAGSGSVVTGAGLLRRYGVRAAADEDAFGPDDGVHVLVPHARTRASRVFVHVERTVAVPTYRTIGLLRVAPVARAVLDACRRCTDESAVRALVLEVVQRRMTSPDQLHDERVRGQVRGSRFARLALEQAFAGVRSVPEAALRDVFESRGVVGLLYNPRLLDASGAFLAVPDAYDPASGVCVEVDSREHHFLVSDWEATMRRHARMTAHGLAVIHVPPSRIASDPDSVVADLLAARTARRGWPVPAVRVAA